MFSEQLNIGNNYKKSVAEFVAKLRLAETLGHDLTLDTVACGGLANVLENLAKKLDVAATLFQCLDEEEGTG